MPMYYDSHDLMTRNAMFNFAIGGRGTGKTYDFKYKRIRHFIKTGKQFIYLRRYKSEFEDKGEFVADMLERFPGYEFDVTGMKLRIRRAVDEGEKNPNKWQTCGFFVTLANALTKKSVPYPNVDWIGFDEFIIDKGSLHYLSNEVKAFLDFYNTVDRFQDRVRVMFMANAVSITNPYFVAWKIKPRRGQRFTTRGDFMCCEMVEAEEYKAHVDSTRFGQFIKGTAYYDYAVGNRFHDDTDLFVRKRPEGSKFFFAFQFDGRTVGVWANYAYGIYYVCRKYPKNATVYVLTKEDLEPNMLMIERGSGLIKVVKKMYMLGQTFFDSAQTREFFINVLDYLGM